MMMRHICGLMVIALALPVACTFENEPPAQEPPQSGSMFGDSVVRNDQIIQVTEGYLAGALGEVEQLDDPASVDKLWADSDYSQISLTVDTGNGVALLVLDFVGDMAAPPMGHWVFRRDADDCHNNYISAWGGAGPEEGQWSFDLAAQEVEIHVSKASTDSGDSDVRNIYFVATFGPHYAYDDDGNYVVVDGSRVVGSFTATIRP